MQAIDVLEQLKQVDPVCAQFASDMSLIEVAYNRGEISANEREHLLTEMRDVRAAQECAGNEIAFRHIVNACALLIKLV